MTTIADIEAPDAPRNTPRVKLSMKLRTKILLIVAVMGVVVAFTGGMFIYTAGVYSHQVDELEAASARAFNGEHLNRLVTAVVMDARGIYASKTPDEAAPFGKGLLVSIDQIDALLASWKPLVKPEDQAAFDKVVARTAEFRTFRSETVRLGSIDPAQANAQGNNEATRANRKAYQAEIAAVVKKGQADFTQLREDLATFQSRVVPIVLVATILGLLAGVTTAVFIATRHIVRPLSRITATMQQLAEGKLDVDVPYRGKSDEIGHMAAAVDVFKENAIRVAEMSDLERETHQRAAARRAAMERFQGAFSDVVSATVEGDLGRRIATGYEEQDLETLAGKFNQLMDTVATGLHDAGAVLSSLAGADLSNRMEGSYKGAFAQLQQDTNAVADKLTDIVGRQKKT